MGRGGERGEDKFYTFLIWGWGGGGGVGKRFGPAIFPFGSAPPIPDILGLARLLKLTGMYIQKRQTF